MKRSWDGCLREVVGRKDFEVPIVREWSPIQNLTTPEQRHRQLARQSVAVLECGHKRVSVTGKRLSVGTWVICADCRERGDPRK